MLRMNVCEQLAAAGVLREYGGPNIEYFFLLGFYRFYAKGNKIYMKAFFFKFSLPFCFRLKKKTHTNT